MLDENLKNHYKMVTSPIEVEKVHLKAQFRTKLINAINIFVGLIIIHILCKTVLIEQYNYLIHLYQKLRMSYANWYYDLYFPFRLILPSQLIAWKIFSPLGLAFLSIIIAAIWIAIPLIKFRPVIEPEIWKFFDPNMEELYYQKLKYAANLPYYFNFLPHDELILEQNKELEIDGYKINIAYLKLLIKSKKQVRLWTKEVPIYIGLLCNIELGEADSERFVKFIIDDNGVVNLNDFEQLNQPFFEDNNLHLRTKIFSNESSYLPDGEFVKNLLQEIDIIQKYNNTLNAGIPSILNQSYNDTALEKLDYIEITVIGNQVWFLIPLNRILFENFSIFKQDELINDCYLLQSTINIIKAFIKRFA